jgi:hypothetical protein
MSLFGNFEHLRYRRFLDASVDGELTGEQARRVRAHLSACPRCVRDEDLTIVVKRRLTFFGLLGPTTRRHQPDGT